MGSGSSWIPGEEFEAPAPEEVYEVPTIDIESLTKIAMLILVSLGVFLVAATVAGIFFPGTPGGGVPWVFVIAAAVAIIGLAGALFLAAVALNEVADLMRKFAWLFSYQDWKLKAALYEASKE